MSLLKFSHARRSGPIQRAVRPKQGDIPLIRLRRLFAPLDDKWNLFCIATILCIAVPGIASVKALTLLAIWALLLLNSRMQTLSILWFFSILIHMALWCEIALLHTVDVGDILNQTTRLFLFFVILSIGAFLHRDTLISQIKLDRLIAWISILTAIIKTSVLAAVLSGFSTLKTMQNTFGFETVSDNIGLGLQRLQFPSDIVLFFLVVSYVGGRRKLIDLMVLLGITLSVLLSFSRFLFGAYLICLLLRSLYLRKLDFIARLSVVLGTCLFLLFFGSLVARFAGQGTFVSDQIRAEQIRNLTQAIFANPIFGIGLGGSIHGYTRSDSMPFSYEVQWYAIAMQFGLIGLSWFLLNLILPLSILLKTDRKALLFMAVFAVWLASGFTNPFIISLGSAFGLCLLMLRLATPPEGHVALSRTSRITQAG